MRQQRVRMRVRAIRRTLFILAIGIALIVTSCGLLDSKPDVVDTYRSPTSGHQYVINKYYPDTGDWTYEVINSDGKIIGEGYLYGEYGEIDWFVSEPMGAFGVWDTLDDAVGATVEAYELRRLPLVTTTRPIPRTWTWDQTHITRDGLKAYTHLVRRDPDIAERLNDLKKLEDEGWDEEAFDEYWELLWDGGITICTAVSAGEHTFASIADYFDSQGIPGAHTLVKASRLHFCPPPGEPELG